MNQQTLMAARSAYPVPVPADNLAWLNAEPACRRNARQISGDKEICTEALMARNIEKILSVTRSCWAAAYANKQLPSRKRR